MEVTIRGDYHDLYDQAGIMIRLDAYHWIKAGIEYVDGTQYLSAVVTRNYSDWSVMALFPPPASLHLKAEHRQKAVHLADLAPDSTFKQFRLAYFPPRPVQVGMMCASPQGEGFEVGLNTIKCNNCNHFRVDFEHDISIFDRSPQPEL